MLGDGPLTFADVLRMQRSLQAGYEDGDPTTIQTNEHRIAFMRQQHTNITVELVEALNELGWKPWGNSRHINALACLRELVDVQHFINNWLLTLAPLTGCTDEEQLGQLFLAEYAAKHGVNVERQGLGEGYDGFAEKCRNCGREKIMSPLVEREAVDTQITYFVRVCPCGEEWDD